MVLLDPAHLRRAILKNQGWGWAIRAEGGGAPGWLQGIRTNTVFVGRVPAALCGTGDKGQLWNVKYLRLPSIVF